MRWLLTALAILVVLAAVLWLLPPAGAPPEPDAAPSAGAGRVEPVVDTASARPPRQRVRLPEPEPDPPPEETADAPEWHVLRVVDGEERPLQGVPFYAFLSAPSFTDAGGELRFARHTDSVRSPLLDDDVQLDGPLTVLRLTELRAIEARLVDLETGAPLQAEWEEGSAGPETAGWAQPGRPSRLFLPLQVPDGWAWPDTYRSQWVSRASRYVDRFVATVPVPREASIQVRVTKPDGSPADGADVLARGGDGRHRPQVTATTDGHGAARIVGFPYRRGEFVRVSAEWREDFATYRVERRFLQGDANAPLDGVLRLPTEPLSPFDGPSSNGTIGIGGSLGNRPTVPFTAGLRVQVVRRDGSPARAAEVAIVAPIRRRSRTDEDGLVLFDDLPVGEVTVCVLETGIVPTCATAQLVAEQQARVVLRESAGRSVIVHVVDSNGAPLPFAELDVSDGNAYSNWTHAHIVDGVQQLRVLTDTSGNCRLENLPHEAITVRASYGSRFAAAALGEGAAIELRIPDADED